MIYSSNKVSLSLLCIRTPCLNAAGVAFTLIKSLDFIPNLRRYIYGRDLLYGETSLYRAEINFGDHRALNRRAEEALDQLEVLFTRIHWQETQEPESSGSSLE
jgi:hypothetical protein